MKEPIYKKHLEWAKENQDNYLGKNFLTLANMYMAHEDHCTYALIEATAKDIEKIWENEN